MHVFLVSRNIRKSLNDIWWYFAYLNVQEIEMPRWVIEIQFRFSKKAIKIGQIFQLIWHYFVSFKQIGRFRQMFVAFLENLNFTSKNRTANPAHPAVLFPGLFWCAFKKPIVVFQLLANVHKTFYDISRHCSWMFCMYILCTYMLLNSCLMFISCV